jgi:hypothetical protein
LLIGGCYATDVREKLPRDETHEYETRTLSAIDTVVIHHVGAAERDYTADEIAGYHVRSLGWPGIGYHFLIHPDGRIELVGALETSRWHAGRWNDRSIGVCLAGTFDRLPPTSRALSRCRQLGVALRQHLGGTLTVLGHRDLRDTGYGPTDCPGRTWPEWKWKLTLTPGPSPAPRERGVGPHPPTPSPLRGEGERPLGLGGEGEAAARARPRVEGGERISVGRVAQAQPSQPQDNISLLPLRGRGAGGEGED